MRKRLNPNKSLQHVWLQVLTFPSASFSKELSFVNAAIKDCQARKLNKEDAMDRCKWRKMIKEAR